MDPTGGGTSADIVRTQIIFGVDPCTRCWDIAQKPPKCKKIPIDSHSNENFIFPFFRPPGAANPQKGRRHIRNQNAPACKTWLESARGLSRNRWPNKKTYSKRNTSPFALTSEWRVIIIKVNILKISKISYFRLKISWYVYHWYFRANPDFFIPLCIWRPR